jgi:aconitate hydratase
MLGQPVTMLIPQVVGFKLTGPAEGATATDLVLTVTEMLRQHGVVGKFVEFYGPGLRTCRSPTARPSPTWRRSTAPRWASSPSTRDARYLRSPTAIPEQVALVEATCKEQGLWHDGHAGCRASATLELDLGDGRARRSPAQAPQDRIALTDAKKSSSTLNRNSANVRHAGGDTRLRGRGRRHAEGRPSRRRDGGDDLQGRDLPAPHGAVVIAAITSCTNTSNPSVMIAAGLLARNARARACAQALGQDLARAGLQGGDGLPRGGRPDGRPRGPRLPPRRLRLHDLHRQLRPAAGADRARPSPRATSSSPRCCRATATSRAGSTPAGPGQLPRLAAAGRGLRARRQRMDIDLTSTSRSAGSDGKDVYLKDIWPTSEEIAATSSETSMPRQFAQATPTSSRATSAGASCRSTRASATPGTTTRPTSATRPSSTACRRERPPIDPSTGARCLAKLGDSVTTDHISPAGAIKPPDSPRAATCRSTASSPRLQLLRLRRGNHEVMMRGTFANIRLKNQLAGHGGRLHTTCRPASRCRSTTPR